MSFSPGPRRADRHGWEAALLAATAFIPPLFSSPGALAADTKTYLYLSPDRLLGRAVQMWDPSVAAGTVPHQNIGYLFPMGPYYWLASHLGIATWVAQRLWWGTTFFAAGLGVLALLRFLDPSGREISRGGAFIAALAYQLSPYILPYVPRHSVLLGAWAALPWFIVLAGRAVREGGWRWPAAFALVLLLVGSINASSLLFAAIGPVLWVLYDAGIARRVPWPSVWAATIRVGLLSLGVSLWWIAGLTIQGRYGVDVLRYTETPRTVAGTSTAVETVRQMGYWFFYGRELFGQFTPQAHPFMTSPVLIAAGFAVPLIAFVGIALSRWRHRAFLVLLVLVGLFVSVGDHRWGPPSLWQVFWSRFTTTSSGLALRSTPRAVPLVSLGLAGLIGLGLTSITRTVNWTKIPVLGLVAIVLVVNMQPLVTGDLIAGTQRQPAEVPAYWKQAAASLSAAGNATRVLTLPGTDFAAYRWGYTLEPVLPGLTDRPSLQREAVPYGGLGTVDLLLALDRRLQQEVLDPAALAPIARLLGVGDILEQNDLAYERYPTPRPDRLAAWFSAVPGLAAPITFGTPSLNVPRSGPLLDGLTLGQAPGSKPPAPLIVYPVSNPTPIVRAEQGAPLVLAGNGEGTVDASAVGLLDGGAPLLYSGSLDQAQLSAALGQGADLVVTDSNRDTPLWWGGVRDNQGATRVQGQSPLSSDSNAVPLELFPTKDPATKSHAVITGVKSVQATHEGQPLFYTPEDRAVNAIDGDPVTDWRVVRFQKPIGEKLVITLAHPVTTNSVRVLQTIGEPRSPITSVRLHMDDQPPIDVTLGADSLTQPGQTITFPTRTFTTFQLEIRGTQSTNNLGFAEVDIPGVKAEELISMPSDLLTRAGPTSLDNRLFVLASRNRTNANDVTRRSPETAIKRIFTLPTARSFSIGAQVHLAPTAPDALTDAVLGYPDAAHGGVTVTSSGHLAGFFSARGRSAIDDDPASAWTSAMQGPTPWLRVQTAQPVTVDHLALDVVADGRHSVPTELTIDAGGQHRVVPLPPVDDRNAPNTSTPVNVTFAPVTANDFTFTVSRERIVTTIPNGGGRPVALPVAIAELGAPGLSSGPAPTTLPRTCRADLISIDGTPIPIRVTGSVSDALAGKDLTVEQCSPEPIVLGPGPHVLRTATSLQEGLDVDRVLLASDRGGAALPLTSAGKVAAPVPSQAPVVTVVRDGRTSMDLTIPVAKGPFWLVLGQSLNSGWNASFTGATALGSPRLVDGYANGWYVTPTGNARITVHLEWTPQREVWIALGVSAAVAAACLVIVLRRRGRPPRGAEPVRHGREDGAVSAFDPRQTGWWSRHPLATIVGLGAVSLTVVPPGAAVLGTIVAVVIRRWRWRTFVPAALIAVTGLGVFGGQIVRHPVAGYGWPKLYGRLDGLVWVAVMLSVIDALVSWKSSEPHQRVPAAYPVLAETGR